MAFAFSAYPPIRLVQRTWGNLQLGVFWKASEGLIGRIVQLNGFKDVPLEGLQTHIPTSELRRIYKVLREGTLTWNGNAIVFHRKLGLRGGGDQEIDFPVLSRPQPIAFTSSRSVASPQSIPCLTGDFVERKEHTCELEKGLLHQGFRQGSTLKARLLYGKGGMGKSELALYFAEKHREKFSCIWCFDLSKSDLYFEYQMLADELGLTRIEKEDLKSLRTRVHRKLERETQKPWLFVFDNVEGKIGVGEYPARGGSLLMTSQDRSVWDNEGERIAVENFTKIEATELANKTLRSRSLDELELLLEDWGYFPFAIHQVLRYIASDPGMTIKKYREIFPNPLEGARSEQERYQKAFQTVWQPAIEKLESENPSALHWLELCAYMASNGIPESLLLAFLDGNETVLTNVRASIAKFSLAKYSVEEQSFSLHKLFQQVLRQRENGPERCLQLFELFAKEWKFDFEKSETWEKANKYYAHLEALSSHSSSAGFDNPLLLHHVGDFALKMRYDFEKAFHCFEKAVAILRILPECQMELCTVLHGLGLVKSGQGNERAAIDYYVEAIQISKAIDSPFLLGFSENSLGETYRVLGELDHAMEHHTNALAARSKISEEHPDSLAKSYSSIGLIYRELGQFNAAIEHCENAITLLKKVFGDNHFHIGTILKNIGDVYWDQGVFPMAEAKFREALAMHLAAFKTEDHPEVAITKMSVAQSCFQQEKLDDAKELLDQVLKVLISTFGEHHHQVGTCRMNLSNVLLKQDKFKEAYEEAELASVILRNAFGEQHVEYGFALSSKGAASFFSNRIDETITCYEKAEAIFKKANKKSIHTSSGQNLGVAYALKGEKLCRKGDYDLALDYLNRAIRLTEFKTEQPFEYARALDLRGSAISYKGDFKKAFDDYGNAAKIFSTRAPMSDREALFYGCNQINLACACIHQKKKPADVLKHLNLAYNAFKKGFGEEHTKTVELSRQVQNYKRTGSFDHEALNG